MSFAAVSSALPTASALLPAPTRHLPSLDGLRGLAILMVVTHNVSPLQPEGWFSHVVTSLFDRGWIGVQLFFVLSGFLITGIVLDTRHHPRPYAAFFGARVLRILPLYYATLVGVLAVLPRLHHDLHAAPGTAWWLALFLSNWVSFPPGDNPLPHFWSLAVEEQFYLLWPFLVRRLSLRGLVKFCLGLTVGALIVRWVLLDRGVPCEAIYRYSVCRMDALACGAAASALLRLPGFRVWQAGRLEWLWLMAAVLLAAAAASGGLTQYAPATQRLGYFFLSIGLAAAVLALACADVGQAQGRWTALLRQPGMRRVGRYSYGMYVLHVPLHAAFGLPLLQAWSGTGSGALPVAAAYVAGATLASCVLGGLSYHLFEAHFLRLKSRLQQSLEKRGGAPAK